MNFRPKKFTEDMLVDGFKTHGDIKGVQIFRSNGYIHFQKYYDGANALKSMHGKNLYGARLEVAYSRLPWDVICKRHRNHVKKNESMFSTRLPSDAIQPQSLQDSRRVAVFCDSASSSDRLTLRDEQSGWLPLVFDPDLDPYNFVWSEGRLLLAILASAKPLLALES